MKKNNTIISNEAQQQAEKVAKATQRPGQTKEQTRLIAQGIAKGIAEYKKQHKQKARQADKAKKKSIRPAVANQASETELPASNAVPSSNKTGSMLPWILLILSWIGFALYLAK
ncbi:DUF2956 domain-containing protein [Vibrio gallicus]|uniref:DUF2956 domain-containing protein n=1 Tax=Vibrio gallicus TaxID=190897 RepID=UPI0021C3375E|nr:DUF2956 domain-containing protein [Vibrio gallicus]